MEILLFDSELIHVLEYNISYQYINWLKSANWIVNVKDLDYISTKH